MAERERNRIFLSSFANKFDYLASKTSKIKFLISIIFVEIFLSDKYDDIVRLYHYGPKDGSSHCQHHKISLLIVR